MPLSIHPLQEWPQILRKPARILAMDIGTKTFGLALSTPDWQMALPLTTVRRTKWTEDLKALDKALSGYGIGAVVVGLPYQSDDQGNYEGPQAQSIKQTVFNLIATVPKWLAADGIVTFWDERQTTVAAQEVMFSHHTIKSAKQSGALDAMAAQIILERALDALNWLMNKEG